MTVELDRLTEEKLRAEAAAERLDVDSFARIIIQRVVHLLEDDQYRQIFLAEASREKVGDAKELKVNVVGKPIDPRLSEEFWQRLEVSIATRSKNLPILAPEAFTVDAIYQEED